MIVFNPDLESQSFSFIPRIKDIGTFKLYITKELSNVYFNAFVTYPYIDGVVFLEDIIIPNISEGDRYNIRIQDVTGAIIFRGQAIATSQVPQEYKDTNNVYIYE